MVLLLWGHLLEIEAEWFLERGVKIQKQAYESLCRE